MANRLPRLTSSLGWELITQICEGGQPKNVVVSSLSVTIVLGMLAGGADLEHRKRLCTKMGIQNPDNIGQIFSDTIARLAPKGEGATLSLANAIFVDRGRYDIYAKYETYLENFSAQVGRLPSLPDACSQINEWISNQTLGLINDLLKPIMLIDAQFLLVNCLAFKGIWKKQFDPLDTKPYTFHNMAGDTTEVQMMMRSLPRVLVADTSTCTAIKLLYREASTLEHIPFGHSDTSAQMAFVAYLPHPSSSLGDVLREIQSSKTLPQFTSLALQDLGLPRFTVNHTEEILPALDALGYPILGSYSELGVGSQDTVEASIIHSAIVKVDEEGTTAAAATVFVASFTGPPPARKRSIIFDRPFAFSIVEEKSNMTVFSGIVVKGD